MLIIPSLIEETCDHDLIVTKFSEMESKKFGMIALVPSTKYCKQYQALGATITTSKNIFNELDTPVSYTHLWTQANCMALHQPLGIRKEILQRLSQYS